MNVRKVIIVAKLMFSALLVACVVAQGSTPNKDIVQGANIHEGHSGADICLSVETEAQKSPNPSDTYDASSEVDARLAVEKAARDQLRVDPSKFIKEPANSKNTSFLLRKK